MPTQLNADCARVARELREAIDAAAANTRRLQSAGEMHDAGFEMGRQAGLLLAVSKLERALAEAE